MMKNEFCFIGDILVFMPGQEDIEVTCELLTGVWKTCTLYLYLCTYYSLKDFKGKEFLIMHSVSICL